MKRRGGDQGGEVKGNKKKTSLAITYCAHLLSLYIDARLVTAHETRGEGRARKARTRAPKNTDQLRGAPAVVADGDDVAEGAAALPADALEDVDESVGRCAAAEDDDARLSSRRIRRLCWWVHWAWLCLPDIGRS